MNRSIEELLEGPLLRPIYEAITRYGALPDYPSDARDFLQRQLDEFVGTDEQFVSYIRSKSGEWFRSAAGLPPWIQEAEWQYADGRPMLYVGYVGLPENSGWLHDEARFFVFWSPELGMTKVVIQVS